MGVQGLWSIIESTGQPIPANSLRGKVLAIDVSIWLHQSVKGYRDKDGNPLPNAHLLGVFHRICKLLNYGVRPIFVFDGGVPALKRQTMSIRRERKLVAQDKSDVTRTKLLSNFIRQQLQMKTKQALPATLRLEAGLKSLSPKKKSGSPKKGRARDEDEVDSDLEELRRNTEEAQNFAESFMTSESEDSDSSLEYRQGRNYAEHFASITSPNFDSLPLESQHEILFQMQESKKTNSWNKMHEMPRNPDDFSSFQMDRLVKRRFLQKKIQTVQQEMGQRHIHVQNLDDLAEFESEFGTPAEETTIIGSKEKGALLLKPKEGSSNPQPGPSRVKAEPEVITIDDYVQDWSSDEEITEVKESKDPADKLETEKPVRKLTELEADIELAIQLSLEQSNPKIEAASGSRPSVSSVQEDSSITRKRPSSESESPNKSPRKSSSASTSELPIHKGFEQAEDMFSPMYKFLGWVGYTDKVPTSTSPIKVKESIPLLPTVQEESSSGSGSDFEDVEEIAEAEVKAVFPEVLKTSSIHKDEIPSISFLFDVNKNLTKEEDMFADIFEKAESEASDEAEILTPRSSGDPAIPVVLNFNKNFNKEMFADIFENHRNEIAHSNEGTPVESEQRESSTHVDKSEEQKNVIISSVVNATKTDSRPVTELHPIPETEIRNTQDEIEWDSDPEIDSDLEEMLSQDNQTTSTSETVVAEPDSPAPRVRNQQIARTLGTIPSDRDSSVKMITKDFLQAQQQLNTQEGKLRSEKGFQERLATSITDQMYTEAQELLTLFGIPYIVSPMEAESQCAFLDTACLTDGTITDDSDVWLFGGRRVYKNFFAHGDKHVEFYQYATILQKLNLTREKLVLMAMLTGSDYTNGVEGAGPVTALEIISEFPSDTPNPFDGLVKFHEWWETSQTTKDIIDAENNVREKLRKLRLPAGFPNPNIYEAYMNPTIDMSTEKFRWGDADLDSLRQYTKTKFGWDELKCNSALKPALKNFDCQAKEISRQMTLDSFVTVGHSSYLLPATKRKIKSRRLAQAMKKLKRGTADAPNELNLSSNSDESDTEAKPKTSKKPSKPQKKVRTRVISSETDSDEDQEVISKKKQKQGEKYNDLKDKIQTTTVRIPQKVQDIPVLQKTKEESEKGQNKLKAIEVFKKSKNKKK